MNWTDDQLAIIETKGRELLVSAAAGSGKTTVLVERIYRRITAESDHTDIDRFVVVTFTKAAAAEMKDRLRRRMETALREEELSNEQMANLRRQLRLLPGAHISTVHSFCNYVIGQYFHRIGIDPSLKQGSETELKLLMHEVADQLLALEYEEEKPDFVKLAGLFTLNKSDAKLEDWILQIYEKMMSEPFPDKLFERWEEILGTKVTDEKSPYIDELLRQLFQVAHGIFDRGDYMKNTFVYLDGKKFSTITKLIDISKLLIEKEAKYKDGKAGSDTTYNECRLVLLGMDFSKGLPKKSDKDPDVNAACMVVTPLRDMLEEQRDSYILSPETLEKEREKMSETCLTMLRLAKRFGEMYSAAKRERGIEDFNDLEQFALKILYEKDEDGNYIPSAAASELASGFDEIMIDEYQDSNRVQDTILWAVSGHPDTKKTYLNPWEEKSTNRFIVGDIKQSIYRFRNACPELFEQKLKEDPQPLTLSTNFRSAEIIIDGTNAVFRHIMHEDVGGVEYDKDAELNFGAIMPKEKPLGRVSDRIDIDELIYPEGLKNKTRAEATHIANRILEITDAEDPLFIRDGDNYRPARLRDIVILSRAVSPIAGVYAEVFREKGIPFFTEQKEGFFGTREISLMLEFLTIIDNPRQDIPLAGVLTGPMFNFSEEELSRIYIGTKDLITDLYGRLRRYPYNPEVEKSETNDLSDDEIKLQAKIKKFFNLLNKFRDTAMLSGVSAIIEMIYDETGIYDFFAMQPDGERRCANLDYLLQMVTEFDRSSYQGVHSFIEYISRIISRNEDTGEPLSIGETDDVVRMMTIHKSKGLEFPIVIIARMDSDGNRSESSRFITDPELGLAGYMENVEKGLYVVPVINKIIQRKNKTGNVGELFRLFYVAMTRAKDHLIMVCEKPKESKTVRPDTGVTGRSSMLSFSSMIAPAVYEDNDGELFRINEIDYEQEFNSFAAIKYYASVHASNDIVETDGQPLTTVAETDDQISTDSATDELPPLPAKISVSDLKKESYDDDNTVRLYPEKESDENSDESGGKTDNKKVNRFRNKKKDGSDLLPRFMRSHDGLLQSESGGGEEPEELSAPERGTIYHHVMANIDLAAFSPFILVNDGNDLNEPTNNSTTGSTKQTGKAEESGNNSTIESTNSIKMLLHEKLTDLVTSKHMRENELKVIDEEKIFNFISCPLGKRMIAAASQDKLHREQPFIISKPANEIEQYKDRGETTPIMIQGVIDAYFEEEDGIVLMDYKTDKIKRTKQKTAEEVLIESHRIQLELYREALETVIQKPVKETWIYSFSLDKQILLT